MSDPSRTATPSPVVAAASAGRFLEYSGLFSKHSTRLGSRTAAFNSRFAAGVDGATIFSPVSAVSDEASVGQHTCRVANGFRAAWREMPAARGRAPALATYDPGRCPGQTTLVAPLSKTRARPLRADGSCFTL